MLALIALLADATTDAAKGPSPAFDGPFLFLAMGISFLIFIFLPMRRDARVRREMMKSLKKNDRVVLNGFMIGQVMQIIPGSPPRNEDELLVKIDENANIKMRVLRSSVTRILASDEPTKDAKEGT